MGLLLMTRQSADVSSNPKKGGRIQRVVVVEPPQAATMTTKIPKPKLQQHPHSLLQRLGGPEASDQFTHAFVHAIGQETRLAPFFRHVPVETIRLHQRQLFQLVFDHPHDTDDHHDDDNGLGFLHDFLLVTHSRLFRELGLSGTQFDWVAGCFVQAAQAIEMPPALLQECLAIVGPLRDVFVQGAALAREEQQQQQQQQSWQEEQQQHFGTKEEAKEDASWTEDATETTWDAGSNHSDNNRNHKKPPSSSSSPPPSTLLLGPLSPPTPAWLLEILSKAGDSTGGADSNGPNQNNTSDYDAAAAANVIGPWLCALTERLTIQDPVLKPIFLAMPYKELVPYLQALLQMAFCGGGGGGHHGGTEFLPGNAAKLIRRLRFPHGLHQPHAQLTQYQFARVMQHFTQAANQLLLSAPSSSSLSSSSSSFTGVFNQKQTMDLVQQAQQNLQRIYLTVVIGHEVVLVTSASPPSPQHNHHHHHHHHHLNFLPASPSGRWFETSTTAEEDDNTSSKESPLGTAAGGDGGGGIHKKQPLPQLQGRFSRQRPPLPAPLVVVEPSSGHKHIFNKSAVQASLRSVAKQRHRAMRSCPTSTIATAANGQKDDYHQGGTYGGDPTATHTKGLLLRSLPGRVLHSAKTSAVGRSKKGAKVLTATTTTTTQTASARIGHNSSR